MGGDIEGHRRGYNGGHGAHKMGHITGHRRSSILWEFKNLYDYGLIQNWEY